MTTTTAHPTRNRPERLVREATAALSRAALRAVLGVACPDHPAPVGLPCWTLPGPDDAEHRAACGARIRRAGYWPTTAPTRPLTHRAGSGGERR